MKNQETNNTITLREIATARSGDKGNHANLGIVAFTKEDYDLLEKELTVEVIANHFAGLGATRVVRYELPNVWAFNFFLYDALGGGASQSPRIDTQGKLLGTSALDIVLPKP